MAFIWQRCFEHSDGNRKISQSSFSERTTQKVRVIYISAAVQRENPPVRRAKRTGCAMRSDPGECKKKALVWARLNGLSLIHRPVMNEFVESRWNERGDSRPWHFERAQLKRQLLFELKARVVFLCVCVFFSLSMLFEVTRFTFIVYTRNP